MDDFLRLNDEKPKRRCRKVTPVPNAEITAERIKKLKKTFQPYWMRGMILHRNPESETPDGMESFDGA
jgi:hypothetical protein